MIVPVTGSPDMRGGLLGPPGYRFLRSFGEPLALPKVFHKLGSPAILVRISGGASGGARGAGGRHRAQGLVPAPD